jgi:hypothetical protein
MKEERSRKVAAATSKITPDMIIREESQAQTITFELPELPGETFRITIPEIIADAEAVIVPWSQASPNWEIGADYARWSGEEENCFRMQAEVVFRGEQILTKVKLTNLSSRIWEQVHSFTCFAFWEAPRFDNPELDRMYLPIAEGWKTVGELFAEHDPGDGPYTFFPVAGGPSLESMWLCRVIPQWYPQVVSKGGGCVVSRDGRWVAGMRTSNPAFLFVNRRERCIHANPLHATIASGETVEGTSLIHIFRGGRQDFAERIAVRDDLGDF